jgi:hypothetical protein
MKKTIRFSWTALALSLVLFSCKKETPEKNDEEVITTVTVKLTPTDGGNPLSFSYEDLDGPGGNNPSIPAINLSANKTYSVSIYVLDKTKNPADSVSNEIKSEADAHRFYFEPTANSNIAVDSLDQDANGVSLGLNSRWTTGAAASGTMKITLRHYGGTPPNKLEADPVNSPKSSTDIEIDFPTNIQ